MGLIDDINAMIGSANNAGKQRAMQSITAGLQDQLTTFDTVFKDLTILESRFSQFQTNMGLTIDQVATLGKNMDDIAERLGMGGEALQAVTKGLKNLIGPFSKIADLSTRAAGNMYGQDLIKTSKALRMNLRLSDDIANKYIEMASQSGKSLERTLADHISISNYIEEQVVDIEVTQEMISDIASQTADISLHYGKMPGSLELAVIKSKQLGINMAQLNNTGQNLLNIESSIGQEMEYQLLSGRRLVDEVSGESLTNAYRAATIQGDANKQAMLMNKIISQEGETLKNNLFARQQMASLLQTDEATIAKMIKKQDILKKLDPGGKLMGLEGDALAAKLATLGGTQDEIADVLKANDMRTTDEKVADAMDILTTRGIKLQGLDYSALMNSGSQGRVGGVNTIGDFLTSLIDSTTVTAAQGAQSVRFTGKVGTAVASAPGGVGGLLVGGKPINKTNPMPTLVVGTEEAADFYSGPGGGRMLITPEGTFNLHRDDSVFGGTNLFGGKGGGDVMQNNNNVVMGGTNLFGGKGGGDVMQFAAAVVAAINNQTRELKADPVFGRGLSNSYYG